jgi:hypothetical protein
MRNHYPFFGSSSLSTIPVAPLLHLSQAKTNSKEKNMPSTCSEYCPLFKKHGTSCPYFLSGDCVPTPPPSTKTSKRYADADYKA